MMAAVHQFEGTVNQVMGDGIMALFGAPLAHEDHALRACYAALRLQASLGEHAAEVRRTTKHALTHEVAYGSLLQERRRALHVRIVVVIETLYSDRLAEHVERLSLHALQGEQRAQAARYCQQAGSKAVARSAHREAVRYFEQALAATCQLPQHREMLMQALDLRLSLGTSLMPSGQYDRMFEHLSQAQALARNLDDQRGLGRASCYLTNYLWNMGDHAGAVDVGMRAVAIATALNDRALQVQARFYLSQSLSSLGDYQGAARLLEQNVASLQGDLLTERFGLHYAPAVNSRGWLAMCLAELGEFRAGAVHAQMGV